MRRRPPRSPLFPYTTLFRSGRIDRVDTSNGHFLVRDYKGGTRAPKGADWERDRRLQVALYMLAVRELLDRKSTRLNSSHANISYAVFCLKKNSVATTFRTNS